MYKRSTFSFFLTCLSLLYVAAGCSDDSETAPPCVTDLTGSFTLNTEVAYTRDTVMVTGFLLCERDLLSIQVNGSDITPITVTLNSVSFQVPVVEADSLEISILVNQEVVGNTGKIALFPGDGTWTEVAPFPGEGRGFFASVSGNGFGYLAGGQVVTGLASNLNTRLFTELYQYEASSDTWTLLADDDRFRNVFQGSVFDNQVFLEGPVVFSPLTTYNISTQEIGMVNRFPGSISGTLFSAMDNLYAGVNLSINLDSVVRQFISIEQFDASNESWSSLVQLDLTGDEVALFNFSFVKDNKAFIGFNRLNSRDINLLIYDISTNQLTQTEGITVLSGTLTLLKHLFVIDDIAYFIERGESSIDFEDVSIFNPSSTLYMFNLSTQRWRTVSHRFPNDFFDVGSFTLSNRGFAGLGQRDQGTIFGYRTEFFEFSPE